MVLSKYVPVQRHRRYSHYLWLLAGIVLLVVLVGVCRLLTGSPSDHSVLYFSRSGDVLDRAGSEAFYARHYEKDARTKDVRVEDFYYPSHSPYRDAFNIPVEKLRDFSQQPSDGPLVVYYPDGSKKTTGQYRHAVPAGDWTAWYKNGRKAAHMTFRNGMPDGAVMRWYPDGTKRELLQFSAGKPIGRWQCWYSNGRLQSDIGLTDGAVSTITTWDVDGRLLSDFTVQNGKITGVALKWYPSGVKESETVYEDGVKTQSTSWDEDGTDTGSSALGG